MSAKDYVNLSIGMLRAGLTSYGGGPAVIPLIKYEAVDRYHWMDEEEYTQMVALANALPGPIGTKLAAYVGYHHKKWLGAFVGIAAHILPTTVGVILLMNAMNFLNHSKLIHSMIQAVDPVIVALLVIMGYNFAEHAYKGLGKWLTLLFLTLAFVFLQVFNLSSPIVVIAFLAYGTVHFRFAGWVKRMVRRQQFKDGGRPM